MFQKEGFKEFDLNSSYGKTLEDVTKYREVRYLDMEKARKVVNEPHFHDVVELTFFVYGYAKNYASFNSSVTA